MLFGIPDSNIPDFLMICMGGTAGTANKGNVTLASSSLIVTGNTTLNRSLTQSVSSSPEFTVDTSGNAGVVTSLCVGTFTLYGTAVTTIYTPSINTSNTPRLNIIYSTSHKWYNFRYWITVGFSW